MFQQEYIFYHNTWLTTLTTWTTIQCIALVWGYLGEDGLNWCKNGINSFTRYMGYSPS